MMLDIEYATLAVVAVALAVVTPLAAGAAVPVAETGEQVKTHLHARTQGEPTAEIQNFSTESMSLRNVTATDLVVRELTVRQMGQRENVTLRNVSLSQVTVERARLSEVRLRSVTVRTEQLLSDFGVPYARGSNVTNASRQSLRLQNRTLDGVVIESLTVRNASGLDISGATSAASASVEPSSAAVVIESARVRSVDSFRATLGNQTDAVTATETTAVGTATNATTTESA